MLKNALAYCPQRETWLCKAVRFSISSRLYLLPKYAANEEENSFGRSFIFCKRLLINISLWVASMVLRFKLGGKNYTFSKNEMLQIKKLTIT